MDAGGGDPREIVEPRFDPRGGPWGINLTRITSEGDGDGITDARILGLVPFDRSEPAGTL